MFYFVFPLVFAAFKMSFSLSLFLLQQRPALSSDCGDVCVCGVVDVKPETSSLSSQLM